VVPRKPAFVPVAEAGLLNEWGHTKSGKGTHLLKIRYSFMDRNVPDLFWLCGSEECPRSGWRGYTK